MGTVGAVFRRALDFPVFGVRHRGLRPQHVQIVVKLDRVVVDPVLEAHPFGTASQIRHHLAAKPPIELLAQKTHYLLTAQVEDPVQNEAREQPIQAGLVVKNHVAGKLGLGSMPFSSRKARSKADLLVQRVVWAHRREDALAANARLRQ